MVSEFRVQGLGFRVQGLGLFKAEGSVGSYRGNIREKRIDMQQVYVYTGIVYGL